MREGEELVVVPAAPILDHRLFTVVVDYTSGPRAIDPADAGDLNKVLSIAWFATPSGSITAAQPSFAHRIFPSNDVPSDTATYTIRAVTPAGSTFVANGERTHSDHRRRPHDLGLPRARADGLGADPAGVRRPDGREARRRWTACGCATSCRRAWSRRSSPRCCARPTT